MALRMNSADAPRRTRSTSMTCTPRSWRCSASITPNSPTATTAAISDSLITLATSSKTSSLREVYHDATSTRYHRTRAQQCLRVCGGHRRAHQGADGILREQDSSYPQGELLQMPQRGA